MQTSELTIIIILEFLVSHVMSGLWAVEICPRKKKILPNALFPLGGLKREQESCDTSRCVKRLQTLNLLQKYRNAYILK